MKKIVIVIILCLVFICGCNKSNEVKVIKVNKDEASELIDDGALLVDVRSLFEYNQGHIDGAINIDVQDILKMVDTLNFNNTNISKDRKIILYCRSGSRSSSAAKKLVEIGYTNVYDLGAMDNWN
jgi:phage shock protein E